jgi:hypothetical protein
VSAHVSDRERSMSDRGDSRAVQVSPTADDRCSQGFGAPAITQASSESQNDLDFGDKTGTGRNDAV